MKLNPRDSRQKPLISVLQLDRIDYSTGLRLQQRLVALRKQGRIGDVVLLLEHPAVITLGRNAKRQNIVASPEFLAQRGVEVFECDRGGDVTFHGPGQLVGYPIFDLRALPTPEGKRKSLGAIEYVRRLEEVLIRTCADFAIPAKRICGLTGVWTASSQAEAKIAAIGVHISGGVTSHGFALNRNTDLDYFKLIVPCGIPAKPVTSMAISAPIPSRTTGWKKPASPSARFEAATESATSSAATSTPPCRPSANLNTWAGTSTLRCTAGCCSIARWKLCSKISISRAKSWAEFTSALARKPVRAPRLTP